MDQYAYTSEKLHRNAIVVPPPVHTCCQVKHCMSCRTTAEFVSMSMAERMEVTELARKYWPGTIVNNISAASHVDALHYLRHSQNLVTECQVTTMLRGTDACTAVVTIPFILKYPQS